MASIFNAGTAQRPGPAPQAAPHLDEIKRNVAKMISLQAPEEDIDGYIQSEGASVDAVKAHQLIDLSGPHEAVRTAIAGLPEDQQYATMKRWADDRLAKPQGFDAIREAPTSGARSVALGFSDELLAGADTALGWATGGHLGEPSYDEALALRRATEEKYDRAHPVASTVGQIAGGFIAPGQVAGAAPAVGGLFGAARTGAGRIARGVGIGAGTGYVQHVGNAEGGEGNLEQQLVERSKGAAVPTVIGGALGGALTGGAELYRKGRQIIAGVRPQAAAETSIIESLPGKSVDGLADQVAVGSYRTNAAGEANMRGTLDILGEEMVRANGDRAAGVQAAINRIARERQITPATARNQIARLSEGHQDGDLFLGEYPSVAGADRDTRGVRWSGTNAADRLDDVRRIEEVPSTDQYTYAATSQGPGAERVRGALNQRGTEARDSFREWLGRVAPNGRTLEDAEDMISVADQLARRDYQAAHNGSANNRALIYTMPKLIERHLNRMAGRSGAQAQALRQAIDEFYIDLPTGQRMTMQSLQHLQDARGAVRDMIDTNIKAGNRSVAATLQPFYDDVTKMMQRASPDWARANARWADGRLQERALELGELMTTNPGPAQRAALRQFDQMAPEAQDVVRIGFLQQMDNKLQKLGDSHDVAKLFTNEVMRGLMVRMFGTQEAANFTRLVRNLEVANRTRARAVGGSPTMPRQELHKVQDANINAAAALQGAKISDVRHWLVEAVANRMKAAKVRRMAPVLTTSVRDTPAAAMRIQQLRLRQQANARLRGPRGTIAERATQGSIRTFEENEE